MKINKLALQNYRGIKQLNIDFSGNSAVFFGINGAGKTSVLSAINIVLAAIVQQISQGKFKKKYDLLETDVSFGQSECKVSLNLKFDNIDDEYIIERRLQKPNKTIMKKQILFYNSFTASIRRIG